MLYVTKSGVAEELRDLAGGIAGQTSTSIYSKF